MKTGFKDIDSRLTLIPGDVVVIGSRPCMGKSIFARQIALNYLKENKSDFHTVHCVDFQRTPSELLFQFLCLEAMIERSKINSLDIKAFDENYSIQDLLDSNKSNLTGLECQRLVAAFNIINSDFLQFTCGINEDSLEDFLRKSADLPKLLVIDYIQLSIESDQRNIAISNLMNMIKAKAVYSESIVIIVSQISRKVEERPGRRPMLKDLSDSSSLEEVADKIFFVTRRDYYDPLDKPGRAEIIIAKENYGRTGSVSLVFDKGLGSFIDFDPDIFL